MTWRRRILPLLAAAICLAGCGDQGRDRWLRVFFDAPPRAADPAAAPAAVADSATAPRPAAVSTGSTHGPSEAGACHACHDLGGSLSFPGGGGWPDREPPTGSRRAPADSPDGAMRLRLPGDRLCASCHGDLEGETLARRFAVVHAPVASGGCTFCHDPHRSAWPRLLKAPDGPGLCGRCHDPAVSERICTRSDRSDADCLHCHLPHAGPARGLLRKDPE